MATYLIGNIKGPKGADGVSPTAKVEQTSTGATITITDATGTTTADIRNGVDGDGNNIDLTPYATKTEVAETYATKTYVDAAVDAVDAPVTSVNGMVGAVTITETDPTVPAWAKQPNKPAYTAAEVGALPDTTFIPTVPTNVSAFNNDAGYVNSTDVQTALSAKQDTLIAGPNITIENNVISATGGSSFSGDYNDLTNKPDLSVYAESADLATVATTGSYNDLSDKPTIPTVPTNVSDFANDAGYITSSDLPADELPTIASGDAGKVLAVNSGENGVEWTTPASGGGSGSDIGDLVYTKEGSSWIEVPADLITLFENNEAPSVILIDTGKSNYNRNYAYTLNNARQPSFGRWEIIYSTTGYGVSGGSTVYRYLIFRGSGGEWTVENMSSQINAPVNYTAGTGISLANSQISIDNTVALKTDIPTYTAGNNVTIDSNNQISVNGLDLEAASAVVTGATNKTAVAAGGVKFSAEASGNELGYIQMDVDSAGLKGQSNYYNQNFQITKDGMTFGDTANNKTVTLAPNANYDGFTINGVDIPMTSGGSGGATYTAGNGIEIDANNEIKTVNSNPLIHSMLQMTTAGVNNMPNVVSLGASST